MILKLCKKHHDVAFHSFTNGTLIDEEFCKEVQKLGNLSFSLSLEGFEEANDGRRGQGIFQKVLGCNGSDETSTVCSSEHLYVIQERTWMQLHLMSSLIC